MPRPPLSIEQVLAWADAHHARTGKYPVAHSGPVHEAPDETWLNINQAMSAGKRGFKRRQTTLAQLLAEYRGKRNPGKLPRLSSAQILAWAEEYFQRTGRWPTPKSGSIVGTAETWASVGMAMDRGHRGLPKRSLANLLAKKRSTIQRKFTTEQILAWADDFQRQHGHWPDRDSGPIPGANARWRTVDVALRANGTSLFKDAAT